MTYTETDGSQILFFVKNDSEYDFEKIGDFLINVIKAEEVNKIMAPWADIKVFKLYGQEFYLVYDLDYGVFLKSFGEKNNSLLIELVPKLSTVFE